MSTIVEVKEYGNGLDTSFEYYFVIDRNRLVHISKYAISVYRDLYVVRYEVDLNTLRGKTVMRNLMTVYLLILTAKKFSTMKSMKQ